MNIAIYMVTHENPEITSRVIKALYKFGGCPFDLYVVDSGSSRKMQSALSELASDGKISHLVLSEENIGQNLAANIALESIDRHGGYDWIVCWSPDVEPKTRRSLKKLCRAARDFVKAGVSVLLSPKVTGGKSPEAFTSSGDDIGFNYYEVDYLKGYVRVHPASFFNGFRFNQFGALASGEALEVKDRAVELDMPCVVIENVKCRHLGDEADFVGRFIGYGL